jgi:tRNA (cytidine/uridine-2'-O-)-methyltransferase
MLHLVLYHPAIPQNTGNIARTTVGFNAHLHLIKPYKFEITDHAVQRAGLDYLPDVQLTEHDSDDAFLDWLQDRDPWLITKFGDQRFDQPTYHQDDILILGNENTGLPDPWLKRWQHRRVCIPILGNIRSYNLANAAAIVLAHASVKAGVFGD